tara:strand:- start:332 stop:913 length:582 start_codon:yes stop_codon:yes gene_type:complete
MKLDADAPCSDMVRAAIHVRRKGARGVNVEQAATGASALPSHHRENGASDTGHTGRVEAHNTTEKTLATTNSSTGVRNTPRPELANGFQGHKRKRTIGHQHDVNNFRDLFVPYEPWTIYKLICAIREKTHSFKSEDHQVMFEDLITEKDCQLSKLRSLIITWAPQVLKESKLKRFQITIIASNYVAVKLLRKN